MFILTRKGIVKIEGLSRKEIRLIGIKKIREMFFND
jgi:hypothetical protein